MTYACSNQPRPDKKLMLLVRDGWQVCRDDFGVLFYAVKTKKIPFVQSTECQYDRSGTDQRCAECQFKKLAP